MASGCIAAISFALAGVIGADMLPYQDPPSELLEKYDAYKKTYSPIWDVLITISLVSAIIFLVGILKIFMRFIRGTSS